MDARNILIYLAIKYEGNYKEIYNALKRKERVNPLEVEKITKELPYKTITILDKEYPYYLQEIYSPPIVLFYEGNKELLFQQKRLSVVGTRTPSSYGKNITITFLSDLLQKEKITLVSGLAKGIDKISHEIALEENQYTIAVLASGIQCCYPEEHYPLYETIKEKGLILSEYPGKIPARKENFSSRNRLIAALSPYLFVPEATKKSGTSITVRWAIEQNKEILCVPTHADEDSLPNQLIHDGAKMVLSAEDIYEEMNL